MRSSAGPFTWLLNHPLGQGLVLLLCLLSPLLVNRIDPNDYDPVIGYSSEAQSTRNTSAIGRLFGELRTSMSDILFIKTERYIHSGIGYTKTMDEEADAKGPIGTLIRTPDEDWRGFIGILERNVKPWMDPKTHAQHTTSVELLPWFRLMTLVNPHRIRGYRIGAFILMTSGLPDCMKQAREYIEEGIKNNPRSHELQFMLIRIIQHQLMDLERTNPNLTLEEKKPFFEEALEHARQGITFAAEVRPPDGWKGKGRPAEMEDALVACMHYEVFCLRNLGRPQDALTRAVELLSLFGSDPVLENEIKELKTELNL